MLESLYKRKKTSRFDVLFYIVMGIFVILGLRLFAMQILEGGYYQAKAEGNRLRIVPMTAARGVMYDRNGQILVGSRPAYTISIMPNGKPLDDDELAKLATLLHKKPEDIQKKVNDHKHGYEPIRIANDIPMDVVTSIEEHRHELPGVSIDVEPLRYYPYETMAAQLFGYVGEVSEDELAEIKEQDPNIQKAAEEAVKKELDQLRGQGATGAAVVALDPNTGAVLAMVSAPEFNPNWFAKGITSAQWTQLNNDKSHPFENKVIAGEYPPGSPFKIVTGTAALDLKKVSPDEMIFDSGKHWLIDKRNAEGEALGWLNFNRALAKSDNVYFYEMGNRLGIENIDTYARYFGLGEKTGINLVGEAAGNVASPEYKRKVFDQDWYLGETFDAAIGQSFHLVTPLQMAVLLSQVANGGIRYQPYVVSRVDNPDGTPAEIFGPKNLGVLPVPKNIMDLIREGLRAYAPYDKPQIVVVALVEQGGFGAGSAGPIVRDILSAYFKVPNASQKESAAKISNTNKKESQDIKPSKKE